jgi:hypothetical protein
MSLMFAFGPFVKKALSVALSDPIDALYRCGKRAAKLLDDGIVDSVQT